MPLNQRRLFPRPAASFVSFGNQVARRDQEGRSLRPNTARRRLSSPDHAGRLFRQPRPFSGTQPDRRRWSSRPGQQPLSANLRHIARAWSHRCGCRNRNFRCVDRFERRPHAPRIRAKHRAILCANSRQIPERTSDHHHSRGAPGEGVSVGRPRAARLYSASGYIASWSVRTGRVIKEKK
jgi:hypothetical protein